MPKPELIAEILVMGENRKVFSIAAAGKNEIYTNHSNQDEHILELFLECIAANTFQIRKDGVNITPVYDFPAQSYYSDSGFILKPNEKIEIITGGAGSLVGHIRKRLSNIEA